MIHQEVILLVWGQELLQGQHAASVHQKVHQYVDLLTLPYELERAFYLPFPLSLVLVYLTSLSQS